MLAMITLKDDSGNLFRGEVNLVRLRSKVVDDSASARRRNRQGTGTVGGHPRTPMDGLRRLHQQGVFSAEKDFKSVESELSSVNCNFPKASLAKALGRADFLTRHGTRGSYRWIQRYPPGA